MAGTKTTSRERKWRSGVLCLFVIVLLQGCSGVPASSARGHVALDRLLALPLEKLVTALGDASIWRAG